jgi:K+-transporting ATPase ATPase C chain
MRDVLTASVFVVFTFVVCAGGYPGLLWLVAHGLAPRSAEGQLLERDGVVVGSAQIAQGFTRPGYLWPRPSAVDYDAAASGGSNLSPANPAIAERARALLALPGTQIGGAPVPAELVLASGSGLDPHLTLEAALYQAPRIATARGVGPEAVRSLFTDLAGDPAGGLAGVRLVNVLEANLALDTGHGRPGAAR